jgi:hypothetical protein
MGLLTSEWLVSIFLTPLSFLNGELTLAPSLARALGRKDEKGKFIPFSVGKSQCCNFSTRST